MRTTLSLLLICLTASGLSADETETAASTAPRLLSLAGVIQEVESANLDTLIAREGVTQAVESIRRARAGLLPQAHVEIGQSRNRTVFFGLGDPIHTEPFNRFAADLSVAVPVINMTSIALYQEARHVAEKSRYEYEAALEDLKLAASELFVASLRAREALDLARASLARAERLRKIAAERVEAGRNSPIDLSRARLEESHARQTVIERETAVFEADQRLKRFLNIDLLAPVEPLAIDLASSPAELPEHPPVNLGAVLEKRSDYLAGLKAEERARLLVRAADWQRLPSLNLYGSYGYATETPFDGEEKEEWSMGVAVSIPVFEGFRTRAEKAIAESQLRAAEHRVLDISRKVQSEVLIAWEQVRAARSRLEVGRENLSLAQETYRFALNRFREGATDNRELIEAQLGLDAAEINLLDLRLQHLLARLYFARACGSVETVFDLLK